MIVPPRLYCLAARCLERYRRVSHGGALPGFRANISRFPNDSLTVIVLTNGDGAVPRAIAKNVALFAGHSGENSR